tara:strand:- start:8693 stop:9151 length:459 start_codon:yes stop_codon:yes gene_type:complete
MTAPPDTTLHSQLLRRAEAKTALPNELNALALLYDTGVGCSYNRDLALHYLRRAAQVNFEIAQVTLAVIIGESGGDPTEWYLRAAKLGNAQSMCWLGKHNIECENSASCEWLHRAAALGDNEAITAIRCKVPCHELLKQGPQCTHTRHLHHV